MSLHPQIEAAGYDPLVDEGKPYAERVATSGVEVAHKEYPGMVHRLT